MLNFSANTRLYILGVDLYLVNSRVFLQCLQLSGALGNIPVSVNIFELLALLLPAVSYIIKNTSSQAVLFQQMPELENCRLIRNRLIQ